MDQMSRLLTFTTQEVLKTFAWMGRSEPRGACLFFIVIALAPMSRKARSIAPFADTTMTEYGGLHRAAYR